MPKVKAKNSFMNTPNFFIVGAAKAGTTSLYNYLLNHPEVYLSPIKEPNYFNTELKFKDCRKEVQKKINLNKKYFSREKLKKKHIACLDNLEDYLKLFREVTSEKVIAEASTSYLASVNAAKEIYKFNSKAKILIVLREPVSRTISHYNMDLDTGKNTGHMLDDIKNDFNSTKKGYFVSNMYVELSLYYNQVKRYLDVFPKEQILVLRFEDLIKDRLNVLSKLCDFLNIDFYKLPNIDKKVFNKTTVPKFGIVRRLMWLNNILPKSIKSQLLFMKTIFFTTYKKEETPKRTIDFLKSLLDLDFERTNNLLDNHFNTEL